MVLFATYFGPMQFQCLTSTVIVFLTKTLCSLSMTPKIHGKNCLFSAFHPNVAGVFAQFDVRLRELNIARAKKWCLEDYISFPFKQFSPFSRGHVLILRLCIHVK